MDAGNTAAIEYGYVPNESGDGMVVQADVSDGAAVDAMFGAVEAAHRQRYGFVMADKGLLVEAISVEVVGETDTAEDAGEGALVPLLARNGLAGMLMLGRGRRRKCPVALADAPLVTLVAAIGLHGAAGEALRLAGDWPLAAYGLGAGFGWALAIVALAGLREKMKYCDVPEGLRGLGITFITVGLMAIGFMAFAGIQL